MNRLCSVGKNSFAPDSTFSTPPSRTGLHLCPALVSPFTLPRDTHQYRPLLPDQLLPSTLSHAVHQSRRACPRHRCGGCSGHRRGKRDSFHSRVPCGHLSNLCPPLLTLHEAAPFKALVSPQIIREGDLALTICCSPHGVVHAGQALSGQKVHCPPEALYEG